MLTELHSILSSFTAPIEIPTNPLSMLWLIPLAISIVVVYKATKMPSIRLWAFVKECATLLGSIIVFVIVTALVLYGVAWLITG